MSFWNYLTFRNSRKCRMSGSSTKKSCESSAIFQDNYTKYLKLEGFKSQKFSSMKQNMYRMIYSKVEKILEGSLDSIPSPSPSVKIQIMSGKVCLRCKSKTLLGIVNKLCWTKSLLTARFCLYTSSQLSRS